jgi:uncharacterized membrane protein YfcA
VTTIADFLLPILLVCLAGGFAGFMSGLLGIGGGFVVVPALYLLAGPMGIAPDLAMHMALGTSLAAMIATTWRSARAHDRRGSVDWIVLKRLIPAILLGAVLGALIASHLKGALLTASFASAALVLSIRTFLSPEPGANADPPPLALAIQYSAAAAIGFASSIIGIGGAAFGAPLLNRLGLGFHRVIGTAAYIGVTIAIPAALIYALSGLSEPDLPPLSIGYVNLPGCALILGSTQLTTSFGVRLSARLSAISLRRIFAAFLMATALRMFWSLI